MHFTPHAVRGPDALRVLPADVAGELLAGMAAHHACGFHTQRWADAFAACCAERSGRSPPTFVSPARLGPRRHRRASPRPTRAPTRAPRSTTTSATAALIVRVDRIELSKNLLRGFHAFDDLLDRYPEWRGRVVFGAFVYPSREGLPEYLAYRQEVEGLVAEHQRALGDAGRGRRSCSTLATTSPARSPRCSATTSCWSTRSATA